METPCFLIHRNKFTDNCKDILDSFQKFWPGRVGCGYSVKTNNHIMMLKLALEQNLYAEVVSEEEYKKVRECGFENDRIIYNGPVKGKAQIDACKKGAKINVDHFKELRELVESCGSATDKMNIGLRINFDLESMVPGETSTGDDVGRFGFSYENGDLDKALQFLKDNSIKLAGLHVHYTTKTRSLAVFEAIAQKISEVYEKYLLQPDYIDIGGGFWGGRIMEGKPSMEEYAEAIVNILMKKIKPDTELILEPGSAMSATVVDYITTVDSVKDIRGTRIVTVDGSSLHINPFMNRRVPTYLLPELRGKIVSKQEICGATCLENDRFMTLENEREIEEGTRIIFTNAGAYTMSLVSEFIVKKPTVYLADE